MNYSNSIKNFGGGATLGLVRGQEARKARWQVSIGERSSLNTEYLSCIRKLTIILSPWERVRERVDLGGLEDKRSGRQADIGGCSQRKNKFLPLSGKVRMGFNPLISEGESNSPKRTYRLNVLTSPKCAFTLAEVLITLGIIGVVAALSMPTLINKYREKVVVTKLENAYSQISQAYLKALEPYGGDARNTNCIRSFCFMSLLEKELPVLSHEFVGTQEFGCIDKQPCYSSSANSTYRMELSNGFLIYYDFNTPVNNCTYRYANWDGVDDIYRTICVDEFWVDINGYAKPNAFGHDIFAFYLLADRILPYGGPNEPYYRFQNMCRIDKDFDNWDGGYNGNFCTAWVLYNKNMDYLHCSDLRWDGKKTCSGK